MCPPPLPQFAVTDNRSPAELEAATQVSRLIDLARRRLRREKRKEETRARAALAAPAVAAGGAAVAVVAPLLKGHSPIQEVRVCGRV